MSNQDVIRVSIHKALIEEFKIRKDLFEKKLGYKIEGGTPVVSRVCAEILKKERLNQKDPIRIEFFKIKGEKKNRFLII